MTQELCEKLSYSICSGNKKTNMRTKEKMKRYFQGKSLKRAKPAKGAIFFLFFFLVQIDQNA
jgi:hypothetical protein